MPTTPNKSLKINISRDGTVYCLVEREFNGLLQSGETLIQRASFLTQREDGQWMGNLQPVRGPVIGPFTTREAAVEAEREWIMTNWLPDPYPLLPCDKP